MSELSIMCLLKKILNKAHFLFLMCKVRKTVDLSNISIISMNCIGGVLYHDLNSKFLSPTINLFFTADDFIKFVNDLDYYLSLTPEVIMGEEYPIGVLDDIKIYFMHFESIEDALIKWEERKKRVLFNRVFVIMVEQNGFNQKHFQEFLQIKYPKILFTKSVQFMSNDSIYFEEYIGEKELPNIIDNRLFYKDMKLLDAIKNAF